jgi:hypothetical protein
MRNFVIMGSVGLTITVVLNLIGWFILHRHSSEFFSSAWRSAWFPNYVVWMSFAIIGFAGCWRAKR